MIIVIYNTCGLSGRNNTYYWVNAVSNLLQQDYSDMKVVISDCCSPKSWRNEIISVLGDEIDLVCYDDVLPLNRTVNLTARKYPGADAYFYLDSGINVANQRNVVSRMYEALTDDVAMVAAQVDTDGGYELWNVVPGVIPIGKTVNLHCQMFSGHYFESYDAILPDVFASDTSESLFNYLCAAIGKKFVLHPSVRVHHEPYMDGASCGFKRGISLWKSKKTIKQLCDEGYPLGLGYEECYDRFTGTGMVLPHNPALYDNGKLKEPSKLHLWAKENLFVRG